MHYTSQQQYSTHIQMIASVHATKPERLMYIMWNKEEQQHYFCFHLLDTETDTVEYLVPSSLGEIENIMEKELPIAAFLQLAEKEQRLYKHVFKGTDGYQIQLESAIFTPILPADEIKIREIVMFE